MQFFRDNKNVLKFFGSALYVQPEIEWEFRIIIKRHLYVMF